jgi:ATP-dependent RNA helicase DeaD
MENKQFDNLNISDEILRALDEMGFNEATPIQSQAIPAVMSGQDVIGQAQTGTGKTCAYGIPAIEMCDRSARSTQVLVLCPTRELAIQVADELKRVSKYTHGVRILAIYGGQHIETQINALKKKPQIIIGTPGRIMDHMRRRTLRFDDLKMVVLDEADEMLNMGFREDIDTILEEAPEEKQMMLFSATMPPEIMMLTQRYQKDPVHIHIARKELTVELIDQYYIEVREASKVELLCRLIDVNNISLCLVFCNTKRRVDDVTSKLQDRGYAADALHGDMKQNERDRVMNKFRHGITQILVATDVAARGIDVSGVEAVFNYDIPEDPEQYVHRIGRTGRAGNVGKSYSFVFGRDMVKLREIMRYTKSQIEKSKPPSIDEVESIRTNAAAERVRQLAMQGDGEKYLSVIDRIIREAEEEGIFLTANDIAAALFKLAFSELEEKDYEKMDFDEEEFEYSKLDMVRLFINAGRMDGLKESHIVKGIASRSSLSGRMIGSIEMHKNFSFVDVPREYVEEVMAAMKGFTHAGRGVSFEVASKKKRGGSKGAKKNRPSRSSGNSRKSDKERKSGRKSGFGKRRGRQ